MKRTLASWQLTLVFAAGSLLAGCENDAASYQIDGKEHALVLIREQRYFWNNETDLAMVVARLPDCQRRHKMKPAPLPQAQVSVAELTPRQFLIQQGDNWYAADTDRCTLDELEQAPDAPAKPLGTFDRQDGKLRFLPTEKAEAKP